MFIRAFRSDDTPALYEVCLRTGEVGGDASGLYDDPDLLGHVWLGAYLEFEPELVRVVDDGEGRAVGFVVGALDTTAFETRCAAEWWPSLQHRYRAPVGPPERWSADDELVARIHRPERTDVLLAREYPAHLHADLLPDAQGHGYGRQLIEWLCGELARRGSSGVHLGVAAENARAVGFYRHIGFTEIEGYEGGTLLGRRL